MTTSLTRRQTLEALLGVGILVAGCTPGRDDQPANGLKMPDQVPGGEVPNAPRHADDVAALCDVILPTGRDKTGQVVSPGAAEADVDGVLRIQDFVALGIAQGLLPPLPDSLWRASRARPRRSARRRTRSSRCWRRAIGR